MLRKGAIGIVLMLSALTVAAAPPPIPPIVEIVAGLLAAPAGPPLPTTSHYMQTADPDVTYDMGCEVGRGAETGTQPRSGLIVLAFGMPVSFGGGKYGASLFGGRDRRTTEIGTAAEEMAHGFWACTAGFGPRLTIAVGTSNYGRHVTFEHGRAWGEMVNRANATLRHRGWNLQVEIVGANDIEISWSSPKTARRWLDGYDRATDHPLVNFGDAAGCPPAGGSCGTSAHPEWEQADVWEMAWGHPPAVPLPEIYRNDGMMAEQWHQVARFGVRHRESLMRFRGAMTQYAACREAGCDESTDNTPAQGWTQLTDALNATDDTAQTPAFSTDISWSTAVHGSKTAGGHDGLLPRDAAWPAGVFADGEYPSSEYVFANRWTGTIGGRHVTVYAGSHAADPNQGVLLMMTVSLDLTRVRATAYTSPTPVGSLWISGRHGGTLGLRANDDSRLRFDLSDRSFER
ncbi:MAG: hypothetical protein ABR518_04210 [Actinomycetota bacterium]